MIFRRRISRPGRGRLWRSPTAFPVGSIHVAVVDPGVGSDWAILYAEIAGRHYLAPDNGLLGRLAVRTPPLEY